MAKPLDKLDFFNFELAFEPQISPDGKQVVYARQFSDIMTDQRYMNLWCVDADGKNHRPLTSGKFTDDSPQWSLDGKQIAFISNRNGSSQIFKLFMDTGRFEQISRLETPPSTLSWSPDGRQIAYIAMVPAEPPKIIDMPAPPEGAEWAEPARVINRLFYRLDQVGYFKAGFSHIFTIPSDGGLPQQITFGDFHHGGNRLPDERPTWTPDSKAILIGANRGGDFDHKSIERQIWEFTLDGSSPKALTDTVGVWGTAVVSPDGKRVAFVGYEEKYLGHQESELFIMNRDGSEKRSLSTDLDRSVMMPFWSSDGKKIAFLYSDQGKQNWH